MRLVRFLAKSFHDGALVEPGTELLVDDRHALSAHMQDVATGETGGVPKPTPQAVFRSDLAHDPSIVAPTTEAEARTFGARIGGVAGAVVDHLWAEIDRLRGQLTQMASAADAAVARAAETGRKPEADSGGATTAAPAQDAPPAG